MDVEGCGRFSYLKSSMFSAAPFSCKIASVGVTLFLIVMRCPYEIGLVMMMWCKDGREVVLKNAGD